MPILNHVKKIIPANLFRRLSPAYHYALAFLSALIYRFPSRKINVIAITGTKGKSTVAELVNAILEEAGENTALQSTIRFKIGSKVIPNRYKMTMPGRFFLQRFLRKAVNAGATYAILEMTSEGSKQFRHTFVELNSLIFTNLAPEHIESHGSYEAYRDAKVAIAKKLETSAKRNKVIVVNGDDPESKHFLEIENVEKHSYRLKEAEPFTERADGMNFTLFGETVRSKMLGTFNISNMLAAATYARTEGISNSIIKSALEKFDGAPGRLQEITVLKNQPFRVFVDYAHTPESLKAVYETFKKTPEDSKTIIIGVLGNTGGGRDIWKRPVMAEIAGSFCSVVFLTNEDPYDEEPRAIVESMRKAISTTPVELILDRREAIKAAFEEAGKIVSQIKNEGISPLPHVVVLITGKGTDPYIMGPLGTKTPWSDRDVAEEELRKVLDA